MATLTLTVPDELALEVLAALKWKYPQVDVAGLTATAAARRILRHMLTEVYLEHLWAQRNIELEAGFNAARAAAKAELEAKLATIAD